VLGRLAEDDRYWQEAMAHYEKATPEPEFIPASQRLTSISLSVDGAEKTLARLQSLRQQLPEHSKLISLLEAEILRKEAQYQRGYDLLSSALRKAPDDEQLRYARSLFSEKLGNLSGLEADLRYIIDRDPENAAALNALGYSLANLSTRLSEAENLVKRALALEPEDPAIIDSYGWILFLKGDINGAVKVLERAYNKSQDHEIASHFGEALWANGDHQRAKTVWKAGLKDTPNSPIIYDTLRRLNLFND
jgi:Flp pilus assembly protein TadD